MDCIRLLIREGIAFERGDRRDCAYFRLVSAALAIIGLLSAEAFYRSVDGIGVETSNKLFLLYRACLDRATGLLPAVLDIDEAAAEAAATEAAIALPRSPAAGEAGLDRPQRPPQEEAPADEVMLLRGAAAQSGGDRNKRPPLIPTSTLSVALCAQMSRLQMASQRLAPYVKSTPKQQCNALYLEGLRTIAARMEAPSQSKAEYALAINTARLRTIGDFSPLDVARQLTLIQARLFARITVGALIATPSNGGGGGGGSAGRPVEDMVAFSTYLTQWCQYEILFYKAAGDRAKALVLMVKVAKHLGELANFDGLKAITDGLLSSPIQRLAQTLALLPKRWASTLESMDLLTSSHRDYAQLRGAIKKSRAPAIPAMAVYRADVARKGTFDIEQMVAMQRGCTTSLPKQIPLRAILQHYLLIQPFMWNDELYMLSKEREPTSLASSPLDEGEGGRRGGQSAICTPPPDLTEEEVEKLAYPEGDTFDVLKRRIQGPDQCTSLL